MADEHDELLKSYLDGPLSPDDVERVNALAGDRTFFDNLVRNAITHDLLRRQAAARRDAARSRRLFESIESIARRQPATAPRPPRWAIAKSVAWFAGAAIILGAMLSFWMERASQVSPDGERHPELASTNDFSVARFSRSLNVEWEPHSRRWSVGDQLFEDDQIELAAGCAELQFNSGAVMTIVGPASLELRSMSAVELHRGTATTRVDGPDSGEFRVLTKSTDVIDRGTEFGVRVLADGKTDVVVFEGEVELKPAQNRGTAAYTARRLAIGEAVSSDGAGEWRRLTAVENDAFPFGDAIFNFKRTRAPVIVGISDDRRTAESLKFYRIFHGALAEDAKAYVDRGYQWNGMTPEGIPEFLRDADYVATFMDDKNSDSPLIRIELGVPAALYVFYDDRMLVPDWLAEGFEDTGFDMGLDEIIGGPAGIGPGISIDQCCSVWRRRVERAGSVELGRIGLEKIPAVPGAPRMRTMYGIAAQPL